MSAVKWLVEPEAFPNEPYLIIPALEDAGIEHVVCKLGNPYERYTSRFAKDDNVVFHGSKQFAEIIRKETNWKVFWNTPMYECHNYYDMFVDNIINLSRTIIPYDELDACKGLLFKSLGVGDTLFLKSDEFKAFSGKIVTAEKWDYELRQIGLWAEPDTLVVAAQPVKIAKEWRVVIIRGRVATMSLYKPTRDGTFDFDVAEYAAGVLSRIKFDPDPIWVMDIAQLQSGELGVLEVGPFACCGLYECDANLIVEAVSRIVS